MTEAESNWERYYSRLGRMPKRLRKTASFIADALPSRENHKAEKVLDLGCGAGRHCVLLAGKGFEVVGIDISKSALKMAGRWVRKEKLGNVALVRATMTNIPLNSCCLDVVISVSVIHHALRRNIVTTVSEIHRILRKNGRLLTNLASVTDPRFNTGQMLENNTFLILEAFEEKRFGELHHFFTKPEILRLLHHFSKRSVTSMKDRPNYWKVLAIK